MAEIALRTQELKIIKDKYITWRPKGAVIIAISEHEKRKKWLEIVCDLVSPEKRNKFINIPGWNYLTEHWTQELRDRWFDLNRPTERFPLGQLLQDKTAAQLMWDEHIDTQLPILIGKEPRDYEMLTNTWLWGEAERKRYFIIYNNDATDEELTTYGLGTKYINEGKVIMSSGVIVDYENALGISPLSLSDITDREKIINPKFDSVVTKTLFNSPDVSSIK